MTKHNASAASTPPDDFAKHMAAVAKALLGEPNPRHTKNSEWRYGTNGSLKVDVAGGRWYDFETETGGNVLELICGYRECDEKAAAQWMRDQGILTNGSAGHASKVVATFSYQDADGREAFQVLRYEPKDFRQRHRQGNQWVWSVKGLPVIPYRLPQLREALAMERVVFVVEGEGKVDLLWSWNVPATCNAGGSKKWKAEHVEFLRDADVIIMGDNDDAGRKHEQLVGKSLVGVARTIRVLHLPGLGPKGDVINWAKAGGTADKLWHLVETVAVPFDHQHAPADEGMSQGPEGLQENPEPEPTPMVLPFINMSNWDKEPVPEREWAVLNRIPLYQTTLFSGEGGAGKSITAQQLCAAHVFGKDWLGSLPERGPAIYTDCEEDPKELHRREETICGYYGVKHADAVRLGMNLISMVNHDAILATVSRSGKVEPTAFYKALLEAAGDIRPKLIAIASSANVYAGDESVRTEVQQFVGLLTRIAIRASGAVLLISHPSNAGISTGTGLSGSTQWHNAVRARFYLKSINAEPGEQPDDDLREIVFKKNQ
jgi:hypothetical protein